MSGFGGKADIGQRGDEKRAVGGAEAAAEMSYRQQTGKAAGLGSLDDRQPQ